MTSVLKAMNDYKVSPYRLNEFSMKQFTIIEDQPISKDLRLGKMDGKEGGKPYDVFLIKVSDGIFEKDMAITVTQLPKVFRCLPPGTTNLKGITIAGDRGEWIFVSQDTSNMNGNFPASIQNAPGSTQTAPTDIGNQIKALHAAIEMNQKMGIDTDIKKLMIIAEATRPGDALGLIEAAKKEGWICEVAGRYRGT